IAGQSRRGAGMAVAKRARVGVAHAPSRHRTRDRVLEVVRSAVNLVGGMREHVRPGDRVLVKPNVSVPYAADEGCTTDPLVVGAVVALAREAGAGHVLVGESARGRRSAIDCMHATGVARAALREGAELLDLGSDAVPQRLVPIHGGCVLEEVPLP